MEYINRIDFSAQDEVSKAIIDIKEINNNYYKENNEYPNAYIIPYGCQMNAHEAEKIGGMLKMMDYNITDQPKNAQIAVMVTCCVRSHAEHRAEGNLGLLQKKYKDMIICVVGCMTQRTGMAKNLLHRFNGIDIIMGTHSIHNFPLNLKKHLLTQKPVVDVNEELTLPENMPMAREKGHSAFVNCMYGCNNFCTYCIVPYVRGRERSREKDDILNEIRALAAVGYKEITVLGQNVNSYGKTLDTPCSFAQLLREINAIDGIKRIRFMTSHPKDITDELIDTIAECDNICEHLHLPVQSGSDKILKKMHRQYTVDQYKTIIKKAKSKIKDVTFSSDIIVGFPGETEEDFEQTLNIIKEIEYDNTFCFKYSKRPQTPAAEYENQVTLAVKKERLARLLAVQEEISAKLGRECIGKTYKVLVESKSKKGENTYNGRTRGNKNVMFSSENVKIGDIVDILITDSQTWSLIGKEI